MLERLPLTVLFLSSLLTLFSAQGNSCTSKAGLPALSRPAVRGRALSLSDVAWVPLKRLFTQVPQPNGQRISHKVHAPKGVVMVFAAAPIAGGIAGKTGESVQMGEMLREISQVNHGLQRAPVVLMVDGTGLQAGFHTVGAPSSDPLQSKAIAGRNWDGALGVDEVLILRQNGARPTDAPTLERVRRVRYPGPRTGAVVAEALRRDVVAPAGELRYQVDHEAKTVSLRVVDVDSVGRETTLPKQEAFIHFRTDGSQEPFPDMTGLLPEIKGYTVELVGPDAS